MNFELTDRCKDYQISDDFPLAYMYANQRTMRLADGPDEVHKRMIAQRELRKWEQAAAPASTGHARPAARVG